MSTYRNRSLQLFSILLVSPGLSGDLYQKELLHRRSFESIAKYDILWPLKHCPTCPTCFKDPRIRIPSFDEAMREILSYREGKATSTRRRKHKKKTVALHPARCEVSKRKRDLLRVLLRFIIWCPLHRQRVLAKIIIDAWKTNCVQFGYDSQGMNKSQCHRCHLVISLFPKMGVTSVASPR